MVPIRNHLGDLPAVEGLLGDSQAVIEYLIFTEDSTRIVHMSSIIEEQSNPGNLQLVLNLLLGVLDLLVNIIIPSQPSSTACGRPTGPPPTPISPGGADRPARQLIASWCLGAR